MTTTDTDACWHTELFIGDDTGATYKAVIVKYADVTGGGRPNVEVGFRKAGGALVYDVVQKSATNLDVVVHRERAGGRVTSAGGHVTDYQDNGGDWLKDVVTYTAPGWVISSSDHVAPAAVPAATFPNRPGRELARTVSLKSPRQNLGGRSCQFCESNTPFLTTTVGSVHSTAIQLIARGTACAAIRCSAPWKTRTT